jgi:hypothetical protein
MLTIKNNFKINDFLLNDLSRLIKGEIKHISSRANSTDLAPLDKYYEKIFITVACKDKYCTLSLQSLFIYSENIDNEINTLQISSKNANNNPQVDGTAPVNNKIFEISKINIYGEERIRIWSEIKKRDYFRQKVDISVGDYYFNNTIIRFESSDDRYINIFAYRDLLQLNFNKNLNIENDFYLTSDLNMGENFVDNDVWTNVQRIKHHYEIGEKGVIKFIDR